MFFKNRDDAATSDCEAGTRDQVLILNGKEATPREYARIMAAQPHVYSDEEVEVALQENAPRPFLRPWQR